MIGHIRQHVRVAMTRNDFVEMVTANVPEAEAIVREHLNDNDGELLLHLLTADLRRLAITWFGEGRKDPLGRLLRALEAGLRDGDEDVDNAVSISFVEDTGWWDPSMEPFHVGVAARSHRGA